MLSLFATAETDEQTARDRDPRTLERQGAVPTAGKQGELEFAMLGEVHTATYRPLP